MAASMTMDSCTTTQFNPTLSIYIPVMENSITAEMLTNTFEEIKIGQVSRVDFVYNKLGRKQAFIHFTSWYNTPTNTALQEKILDPNTPARIIYEETKFWPVLPNKNPINTERVENTNIINVLEEKINSLEKRLDDLAINYTNEGLGKRQRAGVATSPRSSPSVLSTSTYPMNYATTGSSPVMIPPTIIRQPGFTEN